MATDKTIAGSRTPVTGDVLGRKAALGYFDAIQAPLPHQTGLYFENAEAKALWDRTIGRTMSVADAQKTLFNGLPGTPVGIIREHFGHIEIGVTCIKDTNLTPQKLATMNRSDQIRHVDALSSTLGDDHRNTDFHFLVETEGEHGIHLGTMDTRPSLQGQGIGTQAQRNLFAFYDKAGLTENTLDAHGAQAFRTWAKQGFVPDAEPLQKLRDLAGSTRWRSYFSLTSEQRKLLSDFAGDPSQKNFLALVNDKSSFKGKTLSEFLIEDGLYHGRSEEKIAMRFDLSNEAQRAHFANYRAGAATRGAATEAELAIKTERELRLPKVPESLLVREVPKKGIASTFERVAESDAGRHALTGLRVGGEVVGHAVKIVGIAGAVVAITSMAERAEAATREGKMKPEDLRQYQMFITGSALNNFDPTMIVGEELLVAQYDDWAKTHISDPQTREDLRPSTLLDTLGVKTPSKMDLVFAYLPDHPTAETTQLGLDNMIALKQQIRHEAFELGREKVNDGLLPNPMQYMRRTWDQHVLNDHQQAFTDNFNRLNPATVDQWLKNVMPDTDRDKFVVFGFPAKNGPVAPS